MPANMAMHKAWREVPTAVRGLQPPAAIRRWVLQSLFGKERKSARDLQFLADAAKHYDGRAAQTADEFDVQHEADGAMSLGIRWSEQAWPGALEWQTAAPDHVVAWDVTCTVITGFIGKGPLAGYNELRRFTAHAVIPVESGAEVRQDITPYTAHPEKTAAAASINASHRPFMAEASSSAYLMSVLPASSKLVFACQISNCCSALWSENVWTGGELREWHHR